MDTATGERKMLVDAATLKAVTQPEKEKTTQATGLGRVQADNYQWAPGGDSLLFIGSNSLVLLDLNDDAKAAPEQQHRNRRPEIFARWQMGQLRARFQSLGREHGDAARRRHSPPAAAKKF